ncbi:MAG: type II toxin-antitoxin system RelB/DinJ family antitoxin [Bacillota bacterium]
MKDAYINVRVDSGVKAEVETILENLGISTSTAIDMFLSQIVFKNGLPFDVKISKNDYKKRQM